MKALHNALAKGRGSTRRPRSMQGCVRKRIQATNFICGCWKKRKRRELSAGVHGSDISVVDYARQPVKPGSGFARLPGDHAFRRPLAGYRRGTTAGIHPFLRCSRGNCGVGHILAGTRLMHRLQRRARLACRQEWREFLSRRRRGVCPMTRKLPRSGMGWLAQAKQAQQEMHLD